MFTSSNSSLPGGFTNAAPWQTMAAAGTNDPTWAQAYWDDFNQFLPALYSVVGVGTPVVAVSSLGPGGQVSLTTSAAANDTTNLQVATPTFQLTPGHHLFFKAYMAINGTLAAENIYAGLFPVGASPLAANDFLGFICATGQANWIFRSRVAGVNTDVALPPALVSVLGAPLELGFHVDRQQNVEIFLNPTTGNNPISPAAASTGAAVGRVASLQSIPSNPPIVLTQVLLSPTVGIQTTAAATKTLNVDYMVCTAER